MTIRNTQDLWRRSALLPVLFGVATIAACWIAVILVLSIERDKTVEGAIQQSDNLVRLFEDNTVQTFQRFDQTLLLLRKSFEDDPSHFDLHSWAVQTALVGPMALQLSIIGSDGFMKATTADYNGPPLYHGESNHFRAQAEAGIDELGISDPIVDVASGVLVIQFSRPLRARDGGFGGIIVLSLNPNFVEKFYQTIDLGPEGAVILRNRDGVILAARGVPESALGRKAAFNREAYKAARAGHYWAVSATDGVARLVAYRVANIFPLIMTLGRAEADIFKIYRSDRIKYFVAAAILTILILIAVTIGVLHQRRLDRARDELDTALNHMIHGICMFDAAGRIVLFNRRYAEMMGLSAQYLRGKSLLDVFRYRKTMGDFVGEPAQEFARVVEDVRRGTFVIKERVRPDGTAMRLADQPIEGGGWVVTFEDITEQRRAERDRDRNRSFLDLIIDSVPSAIFVKNADDRKYVLVNRAGENMWGTSREVMIGKVAQEVFPEQEAALIEARDDDLIRSGKPLSDEREINTPYDGVRSILSRRLAIRGDNDPLTFILGVIDDVTERKASEARIEHLAHYDALTGLPNRTLFREQLERELLLVRRGAQLAILYLDLDHFKDVNDTLGHPAGDKLLKAVALRLRSCLRACDLIARLGGDEFAIVLTALDGPKDAEVLARRLRLAVIETPYDLDGHQTTIDLSVGISLSPGDGMEMDDLVKHADLALYGAKSEVELAFVIMSQK